MANPWPVIILVVLIAFEVACMVEIVRMDRKASREAKESEVSK